MNKTISVVVAATGALFLAAPAHADTNPLWAALSVSKSTGQVGKAWNYRSEDDAHDAADESCGVADCAVMIDTEGDRYDRCIAVAQVPHGKWGSQYASDRDSAESFAKGATLDREHAVVRGSVCQKQQRDY
ncbi:DUF4189 domain-containing protein [Nocardia sp. BMG51109]|uniref:DUF4189 domain-containing protein n=1 Tax=Nocardia sp. BMG51109 TaxID=1056816 RepID=UPI0004677DA2|nr:DUF4189 domain-containing protein [Nocardia sp. BMG51109]